MRHFYITHRWLRILTRIVTGVFILIILAWIAFSWYVHTHKKELLREITEKLSERVQGRFTIRDMEPSFWRSFPNVSVSLKDVTLRDSMWETHHHSLLDVKDLYVKVNTLGLLSRRVEIKKITAAHGSAFVFSDGAGYSNTYLLARRDTTKKNRTTLLENFGLEDIDFNFINEQKNKNFHIKIASLDGRTTQSLGVQHYKVKASAHVYSMAFSTIRGSYLRDQDLRIDGDFDYQIPGKRFVINEQKLGIGKEKVIMSGLFLFDRIPSEFELHMRSDGLPFAAARSWMSPNISKLMVNFDFSKDLTVAVDIKGQMQYKSIPLIKVVWKIKDSKLSTPAGAIDAMTADGQYYNEVVPGRGHGDDNSEIRFTSLSGSWQNLPFKSDTLAVRNLLVPYVSAHVTSSFPLSSLNGVLGTETFSFEKGNAAADIHYVGGIVSTDTTGYSLDGFVQLSDASMTYLPRELPFHDVKAKVVFQGDNLFLRDVALHTKTSSISMEGDALHFLRLYFSDPGKILVSWRATSPQINLNEFMSFAGKRQKVKAPKGNAGAVSRIGDQLDNVLDASSIALDARVDRLILKNFIATGVVAKATLAQTGITVEKVALQNAGGSMEISGTIRQSQSQNPFSINAVLQNVDMSSVLRSFDNFDQDAISADNIRGKLSATAVLSGGMSDAGAIVKNSLQGNLKLSLRNGELNNYAPFAKISRYVFKHRNLDHLTFDDLEAEFKINGSNITIMPMTVETSAIAMQMAGNYSLSGNGTNIALTIPLRNTGQDKAKTIFGKMMRASGKGVVVHLRAQDGGSSGVKIGWDPLHKGEKALSDDMKMD